MEVLSKLPNRVQLIAAWGAAILMVLALGMVRHSTSSEYAFASLAIIPVFLVAWSGGFKHGLGISIVAASMWVVSDLHSGAEFRESWMPIFNGAIRFASYCFISFLTYSVRTLLAREVELSTHDDLTSLLNRRAFLDAGEAEANRAQRYGGSLAVVYLDLDDFKKLNDSRGHSVGDAALKAVAVSLKKLLRVTDTVARLGGDEFAVMLPEIDRISAQETGNKILDAVSEALADYPPTKASIGIAWFRQCQENFAAMLQAADSLMYEMKDRGKGGMLMRDFE